MNPAIVSPLMFYGGLALCAMWAAWHDPELRPVGFFLCLGFLVSNIIWFGAHVDSRAGLYTMLELMVAIAAYAAWIERGYRALIFVLIANIVSICANISLASINSPVHRQIWLHEVTTNICFAVECLLVTGVGLSDGYRTGRLRFWPARDRPVAQQDAARQRED